MTRKTPITGGYTAVFHPDAEFAQEIGVANAEMSNIAILGNYILATQKKGEKTMGHG
jgi:hypothetical protein